MILEVIYQRICDALRSGHVPYPPQAEAFWNWSLQKFQMYGGWL